VLRRGGGRPYGRLESALRRTLFRFFAGRPLRRVPPLLAGVATATGLLRRVPAIYWDGRWQLDTELVP
jgi:hypothetical protein